MINAGTNKQALIAMGKKLHGSSLIEVLIALSPLLIGLVFEYNVHVGYLD